jgi:hypothetical protein
MYKLITENTYEKYIVLDLISKVSGFVSGMIRETVKAPLKPKKP